MSTHAEDAERLMKRAKQLISASRSPDAAGSAIRADWHKQGLEMMAEAQVHATLALAEAKAES